MPLWWEIIGDCPCFVSLMYTASLDLIGKTASNELASSIRYHWVSSGHPGDVLGTVPYRCLAWQEQKYRILGFFVFFHLVFTGLGIFRRHRIGKKNTRVDKSRTPNKCKPFKLYRREDLR